MSKFLFFYAFLWTARYEFIFRQFLCLWYYNVRHLMQI